MYWFHVTMEKQIYEEYGTTEWKAQQPTGQYPHLKENF